MKTRGNARAIALTAALITLKHPAFRKPAFRKPAIEHPTSELTGIRSRNRGTNSQS
ncbi:MAG: hypothetical protein AB8B99_20205 [Phormidesmis sp.]